MVALPYSDLDSGTRANAYFFIYFAEPINYSSSADIEQKGRVTETIFFCEGDDEVGLN